MKLSEFLLTTYFWIVSVIGLITALVICGISQPFVQQKTLARMYENITGGIILYAMMIPGFWSVKVVDNRIDKTWEDKRYVIVSNHLSFIDSLIIGVIPLKKKYMIAKIFTKFPVFGWLALSSGFVIADKHDPELNKTAVERAVKTIKLDQSSFVLYPEGSRELVPYQLETFKTGAYRIALQTNLEILTVTLKNTYEAMRFGGIVNFAELVITIDEPFKVDDIEASIKRSKYFIQSNLKDKIKA